MKKIISIIVLFGVISSSNAMMVADGVELVSSNSWITGNVISGHMEESNVFFSYANASAIANGGSGRIFTNITSSGNHSFRIENSSKNTKTYTISVKLCADGNNCFNNSSTYRLNAGSNYSNSTTTYITNYYSSSGCKPLVAITNVTGDASANDTGNASVCISR